MNSKKASFLSGLLIGGFLGLLFWYWQKSTSADESALLLLDQLALAEARVRELEAQLREAGVKQSQGE